MLAKEELQTTYALLSTEKLMEIIDNKFGYTELAIALAFEELAGRKISEEEIKTYKERQLVKLNAYIRKNISDDLSLLKKNLFYFVWIPLNFVFKQRYRQRGYRLKLRQANYYSFTGFIFFLVALAFYADGFANIDVLAIWISGFIPTYLFDEFFNRQKQIKKLQQMFDSNNEGREQDA